MKSPNITFKKPQCNRLLWFLTELCSLFLKIGCSRQKLLGCRGILCVLRVRRNRMVRSFSSLSNETVSWLYRSSRVLSCVMISRPRLLGTWLLFRATKKENERDYSFSLYCAESSSRSRWSLDDRWSSTIHPKSKCVWRWSAHFLSKTTAFFADVKGFDI